MWSVRGLFDRLIDPEAMERALQLTVRGKRGRPDVAWLLFRQEEVVERLCASLQKGSWSPTGFELVRIRDPKPRIIARAPIEDRVVHTALVEQMLPALLRGLRPESYACLPGRGAHRAVLRLQELMRRHRFVVHLDVRACFPSVRLEILRGLLSRRIRDDRFLAVVDQILDSGRGIYEDPELRRFARLEEDWPPAGRGLPIGASTSQVFAAHLYLQALDHFVKRSLRVPGYVRYVDDLFLFGDQRAELRRWRREVGAWLAEERGLRANR